jgi:hypothetical protein
MAGASIQACICTGRHIAAFEDDEDAFTMKIKPFDVVIPSPVSTSSAVVVLDDDDAPVRQVRKRNRWAK